jgi:hypothetical protein
VGGDFAEDLVGGSRPAEGPGVLVPVGEPGPDAAFEGPDHCGASVLQIREALAQILMEPDTGDDLAGNLKRCGPLDGGSWTP